MEKYRFSLNKFLLWHLQTYGSQKTYEVYKEILSGGHWAYNLNGKELEMYVEGPDIWLFMFSERGSTCVVSIDWCVGGK